MDKTSYLKTSVERFARQIEKERQVLRFLREEIYSTSHILGRLLGLQSRQAIWKTLVRLESRRLIKRHSIDALGGRVLVWGITSHGQGCAFDPDRETVSKHYFEPSKVSQWTIQHTIAVQQLRIAAVQAGWQNWQSGNGLASLGKNDKRPDGIAIDCQGLVVAVECEKTFKTLRRYQSSLASYLLALKQGKYHKVIWVCPTADQATRLKKIILGIQTVTVNGQRVKVDPARHHPPLLFTDYSSFAT